MALITRGYQETITYVGSLSRENLSALLASSL